jgi:uncharacterized membrane protein
MIESAPQSSPVRVRTTPVIFIIILFVCVTNIWIFNGGKPLPWAGAIAGFFLALGLPAWMLSQKVDWRTEHLSDRLLYSIVSAVFGLMVIGLAINTALPHFGISRPLDRGPVLLAIDIWCSVLALWRRNRFRPRVPRFRVDFLSGADWTIGLLSALCVPMAVIGANRLNNGAGPSVTLTMLVLAVLVFTFMFAKREDLNSGTPIVAVYSIGLALLLMTSLRGWYITGHDIQQEYGVFELTKTHGDWNIASLRNGYNSCLSITILPTILWQVTRVDDPYIYKFWFQLLFALCPVFVYCIAERHASRAVAIITAIYFVAFPTYFTDMPFLNRQEIAFLFVAACAMTATDPAVSHKDIRGRIAIFSIGVVLSHYSTAYVFFATIAIGWCGYKAWTLVRHSRNSSQKARHARSASSASNMSPAISLGNVVLVLVAIILWDGVATHTSSGITSTLSQAAYSLRGGSPDNRSGAVSYSLLFSGAPSESELLRSYTNTTLAQSVGGRAEGVYYPRQVLAQYPIQLASQPDLPVTAVGRFIEDTGLSVSSLNTFIRAQAARLLQLFVLLGLLAAFLAHRRRSRSFMELFALSCAALLVVALQVVLPVISVNYGVLRAFLQALIVFGPFVAVGSLFISKFLGYKWSHRFAYAVSILFFLSLTGVIPQITGGYPAQLNLNNSGQYYDIYYTHPQDISAIEWLQRTVTVNSIRQGQSELEADQYTFRQLQTFTSLSPVDDIFPPLLRKNAYVFLGYANVVNDQSTFSYEGDLITYKYPSGLLQSRDDLLYSSNGARIYK